MLLKLLQLKKNSYQSCDYNLDLLTLLITMKLLQCQSEERHVSQLEPLNLFFFFHRIKQTTAM